MSWPVVEQDLVYLVLLPKPSDGDGRAASHEAIILSKSCLNVTLRVNFELEWMCMTSALI